MNKKSVLVGVVLVVVAGVGGFALSESGVGGRLRGAGGGDGSVRLYGNVEIRDARLSFNGAEHIAEVLVEEGDRVEAGDRLAVLVTDRLDAKLAEVQGQVQAQREVVRRLENGTRPEVIQQAEAELGAAEARLAQARRDVVRLGETVGTGATSLQALEAARSRVEVESAGVAALQAGLALARRGAREEDVAEARARLAALDAMLQGAVIARQDAVMLAPCAGIVQSRVLEPGEYATPDRPVLTLALTEEKWIRAYVSEPDLGRIELGREAVVTSDSFPGESFVGHVGFISSLAEFTPKSVQTTDLRPQLVFEVRVRVDDSGDRLRLGQPVSVEVSPRTAERGSGV